MPSKADTAVARTIGIDTGKNTLHMIGLDEKGAIVLREKVARTRIATRAKGRAKKGSNSIPLPSRVCSRFRRNRRAQYRSDSTHLNATPTPIPTMVSSRRKIG